MQIQKNQMWLVMEPTHPNEHQKTLDETINLKGEGMLELSFFTGQKVHKANLGSWNIKQITTTADTAEGKIPFFTLSHCGFYTRISFVHFNLYSWTIFLKCQCIISK